MKTRFILALLLGMVLTGGAKARPDSENDGKTAKKWFPVGAVWSFESGSRMAPNPIWGNRFVVEKDTVVEGKNCRLIRGGNRAEIVYEEGGCVYYYADGKFRKIYDFNVKEGDVINLELRVNTKSEYVLDTIIAIPCNVEKVSVRLVDGIELKEIRMSYSKEINMWNGNKYENMDVNGIIAYLEKIGAERSGKINGELFPHIVPTQPDIPENYYNVLVRYRDPDILYVNEPWLQNLWSHPASAFDADTAMWIHLTLEKRTGNIIQIDTTYLYGDTVIDGDIWRKTNHIWKEGQSLIRTENGITERKVLYRTVELPEIGQMYNFSARIDEEWIAFQEAYPTADIVMYPIVEKGHGEYCGEWRIYYSVSINHLDEETASVDTAVEGIGYLTRLFMPFYFTPYGDEGYLEEYHLATCIADGKVIYYNSKYANENGELKVANETVPSPLPEVHVTCANGTVHVTAAVDEKFDVAVYNVQGQVVTAKNRNTYKSSISIANAPHGMYFVRVMFGSKSVTKKIFKD